MGSYGSFLKCEIPKNQRFQMVSILKWSNFGWFGGSIIFWKPHIWRYSKMKMVMMRSMKQITWITWMFKSFKLRKLRLEVICMATGFWMAVFSGWRSPCLSVTWQEWFEITWYTQPAWIWGDNKGSLRSTIEAWIGFPDVICKFDTGPFRPYIWFMAEGFLCYHCALYLSSIVCTLVAWLPSCNA